MRAIFSRIVLNFESVRGLSTKVDINSIIMNMKPFKGSPARNKKIKKEYEAANFNLQVLGSGAPGAPASLYVTSDQIRYMFNCGEGTQRLAHEHKMKLSKMEHIFITSSSWKNFGGLPGLCLTARDSGVTNITLYGPKQVEEIFFISKSFVALGDLNVHHADLTQPYEDSVMKVDFVIIESNGDPPPSEDFDDGEESEGASVLQAKRICQRAPGPDQSISFICKLHPKKGKLLLEQCEKFGVPLGPLLGKLKAGEDVILQDGTEVKSSDVTSPNDPGPTFIVVECPDESFLPSLLSRPEFKKHQTDDPEAVFAIFHFTPPQVMRLPEYQEWMKLFPLSTKHITLNSDNSCQGTTSVHRLQHKLHLLHKDIFPLPIEVPEKMALHNTVQGNTLVKCVLRPNKGIDMSSRLLINPQEYVQECMDEEGFNEELQSVQRKLLIADTKGAVYPKITFLGTGSCIPNKTRNVSGILVETSKDSCFLMDCGEATLGQIVRLFGVEESNSILRKLKGVYVSHLHADHHLGLVGVILARAKALELLDLAPSKLVLLLPQPVIPFINNYSNIYEPIRAHLEMIRLSEDGNYDKFNSALAIKETKTCLVKHCNQAYGVLFEHSSGWKMVYSGDTEPCDKLISIGRGCDLLIHEATMEDDLREEARQKRHSTTSEAIEVGQKMGAKFTLLTHFSQRYAKIPIFNSKFSDSVGIAFDNMRISLSQLQLLPIIMPSMKIMFSKYHEEMEIKTEKLDLRKRKRAKLLEQLERKKIVKAFTS
ncbi:ribonuclease Z, mitochondrial-like [Neocloeon triangulifer]|uniref:ribonuclease Z, mitochondrial-like n=1 Tax=Neocloeon triangulifer TaxID=2078957 RepID=UPI00286F7C44|nr:ribonuclease Z, mitochondrial-like [Neocloeon triangulifer]